MVAGRAGVYNTVQWATADLGLALLSLGRVEEASACFERVGSVSDQVGDDAGRTLATYGEARPWLALHEWLANGGTLIAAGDSQYTLLTEPRLRALLPVEVLGLQQVAGLPAFAAHYEVPFPETPMVVVRAWLTRGQVLVGTPDAPLLAQRRFGKGRVVFLAVDYAMQPFPSWQGRGALWNDILQTPETVDFARLFAELGMLDETHPIMKLFGRPVLDFPRVQFWVRELPFAGGT